MERSNTDKFLDKIKQNGTWNDDYDYSKIEYKNRRTKVLVIDKKFKTKHLIFPENLLKGAKCESCNLKDGYLDFNEARNFIRSLDLKTNERWREWSKNKNRPHNIPGQPDVIYKNKGWLSYPDWLGSKVGYDGTYLPFEEARELVRSLKLNGEKEWKVFAKSEERPYNIPHHPREIYKNDGWVSMSDFLGLGKVAHSKYSYLSYEKARQFIQTLNIKSQKEWWEYASSNRRPSNIPYNPERYYKNNK